MELDEHYERILKISGLHQSDFELLKSEILSRCSIAASRFISDEILLKAYHLVEKYDKNDVAFVATTIYLNALLWSGDKKLLTGLRKERFMEIISTRDLVAISGGL